VVEAALCGLPAVVSADCGLTEAIVEAETGLAVPQGDASATAKAIASLLGDDSRRQEMGRKARRHAETEQTWARRIRLYDDLLRELVSLPARNAEAALERATS
jgi:glycosyltransferase involved in cell wall biosynthesis